MEELTHDNGRIPWQVILSTLLLVPSILAFGITLAGLVEGNGLTNEGLLALTTTPLVVFGSSLWLHHGDRKFVAGVRPAAHAALAAIPAGIDADGGPVRWRPRRRPASRVSPLLCLTMALFLFIVAYEAIRAFGAGKGALITVVLAGVVGVIAAVKHFVRQHTSLHVTDTAVTLTTPGGQTSVPPAAIDRGVIITRARRVRYGWTYTAWLHLVDDAGRQIAAMKWDDADKGIVIEALRTVGIVVHELREPVVVATVEALVPGSTSFFTRWPLVVLTVATVVAVVAASIGFAAVEQF